MTGLLSPVALFLPGTTHDYAIWQAGPSILSSLATGYQLGPPAICCWGFRRHAASGMLCIAVALSRLLGDRLGVGRQVLALVAGVRILLPQPVQRCTAPSSRGPGHGPLKAETRVRIPLGPPPWRCSSL